MILFVNCNDRFLKEVALRMLERGLPLGVILSQDESLLGSKEFAPEVEVIDQRGFYQIDRFLDRAPSFVGIDAATVKSLERYEKFFYVIGDRLSLSPLPVTVRRRLFWAYVAYWKEVLQRKEIRVVLFPSVPHMGADLVLYAVARLLQIRTRIMIRTLISDRLLAIEDWEDEPSLRSGSHASSDAGDALYRLAQGDSTWMEFSQKKNRSVVARASARKRLRALLLGFRRIGRSALFGSNASVYYLQPSAKRWEWLTLPLINRRNERLRRLYGSLCATNLDLKAPYVFFALHFQPERTTMPEGGDYDEQLLAVTRIAESLPDGWMLYVKEHPRQFSSGDLRKLHARNADFYRMLARIPRVKLVPIEQDSRELQRNARIGATITGSSGWESLMAGVPAIVFGQTWYSGCAAVLRLDRPHPGSVRDELIRLSAQRGHWVTEQVRAYLGHLAPHLVESANAEMFIGKSALSRQTLVENYVNGAFGKEGSRGV